MDTSQYIKISDEVQESLVHHKPIVALESTVITHGLPYPENLKLGIKIQEEIRKLDAVPATIAILKGNIYIGINNSQLELLAQGSDTQKVSPRDIAFVIAQGGSGGTTVAGTLFIANSCGIRVFATGGIGGVHRNIVYRGILNTDISADLTYLSKTPMMVVCAGAKAILDLPATLEVLETLGVPVVGYQTDEFPAFYSKTSGLRTQTRVDNPNEIIKLAQIHWGLGQKSAILICVPPPDEVALTYENVDSYIQQALIETEQMNIQGQAVTPFLLKRMNELTEGASLKVNIALLLNNARVAARIANFLV